MFQVCVKTAPYMLGFYSYVLETPEDRDAFVKGPDVWWYCYGDADDWYWHKGGAWRKTEDVQLPELPELPGDLRQGVLIEPRPRVTEYTGKLEEDDDDGRW